MKRLYILSCRLEFMILNLNMLRSLNKQFKEITDYGTMQIIDYGTLLKLQITAH